MMIAARDYTGGAPVFREPPDRDPCELLRIRAAQLAGEDRALMTLYLDGGNSFRQIARLTGQYPTSIARRIRRITQRLLDETYPRCLQNRAAFTAFELAVIKDHFVRGYSCHEISRTRKASYYHIRSIILTAKHFVASAESKCRPASPRSS
jgi:hypothetical protein